MYVGKDKNSSLWKWELDWREVSTMWGNRREIENGEKVALGGEGAGGTLLMFF